MKTSDRGSSPARSSRQDNRAYVRDLLREKQPEFAALLEVLVRGYDMNHDDCMPASKFDSRAHAHPGGIGYYAHRSVVVTKAVTYSMTLDNFRRMLGITETGALDITVTGTMIMVSVKS